MSEESREEDIRFKLTKDMLTDFPELRRRVKKWLTEGNFKRQRLEFQRRLWVSKTSNSEKVLENLSKLSMLKFAPMWRLPYLFKNLNLKS